MLSWLQVLSTSVQRLADSLPVQQYIYRRAIVGGTLEFPGQLIASLLVAQWSEHWCTSLVAQGSIPGMSRSESAITRGKTQMILLPPTSFS
jgi:hypothetical protein